MQSRELSSSTILWWRLIFPTLWTGATGLVILGLWAGAFRGSDGIPPPAEFCLGVTVLWALVSLYHFLSTRPYCQVTLANDHLVIVNGSREITVPLSAIVRVSQNYLSRPKKITLHLDRDTPLGREIVFLPSGPLHSLSSHPIADELEALIARYRPTPRAFPVTDVTGTPWATQTAHTLDDHHNQRA